MGSSQSSRIMAIEGPEMRKEDVLLVVHQEGDHQGRPSDSANRLKSASTVEKHLQDHSCVLVELKDMNKLEDYFGEPWTEAAQYKISRAKQGPILVLAYQRELDSALAYVNGYLGGQISFVRDGTFGSFTGPHVKITGSGSNHLLGHSSRCFVKRLEQFCV